MKSTMIRSAAWIFTASLFVLVGCAGTATTETPDYKPVYLRESSDPRDLRPTLPILEAPEVMAVWIHGHRDRERGVHVDGYWIYIMLGDGWTFAPGEEWRGRDPIPDDEATPEDIRRGLGALDAPADAAIPYRARPRE